MIKRTILTALLVSLTIVTISCEYTNKIETVPPKQEFSRNRVYAVVNLSNDWIQFIEPGKVEGNYIVGLVKSKDSKKRLYIPVREVKRIWVGKISPMKTIRNFFFVIGAALGVTSVSAVLNTH
jgi:hypothetical protein